MGVATGGGGGGTPARNRDFQRKFPYFYFKMSFSKIFRFFNISKIKLAKYRQKSEFGVGDFESPESDPSPGRNPSLQSKRRGDVPVSMKWQSGLVKCLNCVFVTARFEAQLLKL